MGIISKELRAAHISFYKQKWNNTTMMDPLVKRIYEAMFGKDHYSTVFGEVVGRTRLAALDLEALKVINGQPYKDVVSTSKI